MNALEFVQNAENAASLITKYTKLELKTEETKKERDHGFQINLLFIERKMKDAIASLKLSKNHILFIDGIDIRPEDINYDTYIECLRGLAQAAWYLNTEFLANIKDSKGRIKVVLLLRPDILNHLGYQNLRGLAQAAWYLNTEFLANIKDSKGRIKVVLLLRPDILNHLGYQNLNAKVRDNSLVLDWRTTYRDYRGSRIFKLIDGRSPTSG